MHKRLLLSLEARLGLFSPRNAGKVLLLCATLFSVVLSAQAQSGIVYVDEDANGAGDGSSWENAFTQLQDGLTAVGSGGEVWVAYGTYIPDDDGNASRGASFLLTGDIRVYGGFSGDEEERAERDVSASRTTLSGDLGFEGFTGDDAYHVVTGEGLDSTAVLDGFYITAGNASGRSAEMNDVGAGMILDDGSFYSAGGPSLRNLVFSGNVSLGSGAGLYNESTATLTNVTFEDNIIRGDYGQGGGIYSTGNLTIEDARFRGNVAMGDGGGLYFQDDFGGTLHISNAAFADNTAMPSNDYRSSTSGGGIHAYAEYVRLDSVAFRRNRSTARGGGMSIVGYRGTTVADSVLFVENSAANEDCCIDASGGGLYVGGEMTLTNAMFRDNVADGDDNDGGGLYISGSTSSGSTLTNVVFESNATVGGYSNRGGGMYGRASAFIDVTFRDNRAGSVGGSSYDSGGGGLYLLGSDSTSFTGVTFEDNQASRGDGGALWSRSDITLTDVTFAGNTTWRYGGALFNDDGSIFAKEVVFDRNSATGTGYRDGRGGAIYSLSGAVSLYNAAFYGNEAESGAGAIYEQGSNGTIANAIFSANRTDTGDGGALYNTNNSSPRLRNVTLVGNSAGGHGGAVFDTLNSNPTIANSILVDNEAGASGNQIYSSQNSQSLVASSVVEGGVPDGVFDGGNVVVSDPAFRDSQGPDGVAGTPDDDLTLSSGSPALDLGDTGRLPADEADLDGDGDTEETLPLDLDGGPRIMANGGNEDGEPVVDAGAHEASQDVKLPVELSALRATPEGKKAVITWQTASETQNDHFEVLHRAPEAETFANAGRRAGAGTTTEAQQYSFTTEALSVGTHAFRLRQVDTDGTEALSDPVEVEIGVAGAFELSEVYPNPTRRKARLTLAVKESQTVEAAAYDARGRRVSVLFNDLLEAGDPQELHFEAEGLASGVYFVRVTGEHFRATRKLVLVR